VPLTINIISAKATTWGKTWRAEACYRITSTTNDKSRVESSNRRVWYSRLIDTVRILVYGTIKASGLPKGLRVNHRLLGAMSAVLFIEEGSKVFFRLLNENPTLLAPPDFPCTLLSLLYHPSHLLIRSLFGVYINTHRKYIAWEIKQFIRPNNEWEEGIGRSIDKGDRSSSEID
jgi:hypothetical protein